MMQIRHTNEIIRTNVYPILPLLHADEPEISAHMLGRTPARFSSVLNG